MNFIRPTLMRSAVRATTSHAAMRSATTSATKNCSGVFRQANASQRTYSFVVIVSSAMALMIGQDIYQITHEDHSHRHTVQDSFRFLDEDDQPETMHHEDDGIHVDQHHDHHTIQDGFRL